MQVFQDGDRFYVTASIEELDELFHIVDQFEAGSALVLCGEELDTSWGYPVDRVPDNLQGLKALTQPSDRYNWTRLDPSETVRMLNRLLGSTPRGLKKLV